MANCPHCSYKLKLWDIRAECPKCGVNIPNYNWEERLEEDSKLAEAAFAKFSVKTNNMKSALFGNRVRIARFILTFAPLIALVIPIAKIDWFLPFADTPEKSLSILNLVLYIVGEADIGSLFALMKSGIIGTAVTFFNISVLLTLLGIVSAVLNFFVLVISSIKLRFKMNIALCAISVLSFCAAFFLFSAFFTKLSATSVNFMGGGMSFGYFVGVALFCVNLFMNIHVGKSFKKQISK